MHDELMVGKLVDEIFNSTAIDSDDNGYHVTSYLERRLQVRDNGELKHDTLPLTTDLPRWLRSSGVDAVYELTLLNNMLSAVGPFFHMIGGSGSGKSSSIQYMQQIIANQEDARAWCSKYSLKSFLLRVDLNTSPFTQDVARRGDIQNKDDENEFYNALSKNLFDVIRLNISDDINERYQIIGRKLCGLEKYKNSEMIAVIQAVSYTHLTLPTKA